TIAENVEDLVVLCSGTEGKISLDDILGGGSIIYHINQLSCGQNQANQMNDAAFIAQSMYLQFRDDLEKGLHQAAHGRKLTSMGRGKDLHYCSQEAIIAAVPEMVQGKLVLK
ncbi:MAG: 2-phosphosulfolactate phosphatase, partial [Clostridiales bacterium]